MIKIQKGNTAYTVTKGAYESMYKPMGFEIVGEVIEDVKVKEEKHAMEEPKKEENLDNKKVEEENDFLEKLKGKK